MSGSQQPECICKFHASVTMDLKIRSIIDMKFESNKEYMGNLSLPFRDSATRYRFFNPNKNDIKIRQHCQPMKHAFVARCIHDLLHLLREIC